MLRNLKTTDALRELGSSAKTTHKAHRTAESVGLFINYLPGYHFWKSKGFTFCVLFFVTPSGFRCMENEVAEFKMQRGYELGEGSGKKKHMLAQAFQKGMEGYGDEPK